MNFMMPNPVVQGQEDCLYLNIHRPHPPRKGKGKKLPVMVFIHGGAFFSGTMDPGTYGPAYFMKTGDVILVNIQYRLSTLGFLATGDAASPGNFGLKDQVMALSWVKNHISAFGGDSNEITIFGQSVGGASVNMHMMSPLSRGLFSRAISMSGSGINSWNNPTQDPLALTRRHAQLLGVANADTISTNALVNELRQFSANELISSVTQLKFFDVDSLTVYRTVVEPKLPGAFLTDTPYNLLRAGKYDKVPFMAGMVAEEGAVRSAVIIVNDTLTANMNADIWNLLPQMMELRLTGQARTDFTQLMFNKYLPAANNEPHALTQSTRETFMDVSINGSRSESGLF